ncbi:hypothetical protein N0V90_007733 [Kalmusia sp. IMI 367209]|nr:hypothetical protein N0V90_007733 [Kalmusia sp. IMI 367209]
MSAEKVLITGATGLIGFQVLVKVLQAGYTARAALRSSSKIPSLAEHSLLSSYHRSGALSFIHVPDFSVPSAWTDALEGIQYVIHVASAVPYPHLDPMKDIYWPNVRVVDAVLLAALESKTIKRVIFTSSIVAALPLPPRTPARYTESSRAPTSTGPFSDVDTAYQASKTRSLNDSYDFVAKHKPAWDVVNILPGYVFGRDEKAKEAKDMFASSNALLLSLLTGVEFPHQLGPAAVLLDDVADVHVKALSDSVQGSQAYGVSVPMKWNDAIAIAQKHFPQAFEKGQLKAGNVDTEELVWDASKSEEVFGMKFTDFERTVVEMVGQYLDLLDRGQQEESAVA